MYQVINITQFFIQSIFHLWTKRQLPLDQLQCIDSMIGLLFQTFIALYSLCSQDCGVFGILDSVIFGCYNGCLYQFCLACYKQILRCRYFCFLKLAACGQLGIAFLKLNCVFEYKNYQIIVIILWINLVLDVNQLIRLYLNDFQEITKLRSKYFLNLDQDCFFNGGFSYIWIGYLVGIVVSLPLSLRIYITQFEENEQDVYFHLIFSSYVIVTLAAIIFSWFNFKIAYNADKEIEIPKTRIFFYLLVGFYLNIIGIHSTFFIFYVLIYLIAFYAIYFCFIEIFVLLVRSFRRLRN